MGEELQRLIQQLSKLPGLGPRSGRRVALHLLKHSQTVLTPLLKSLEIVQEVMGFCSICGYLDACDPCTICADVHRDDSLLCVVADVADVWALERAGYYQGRYHVLGGVLSALDGVHPEALRFPTLLRRCAEPAHSEGMGKIQEVILALNTTVEGQTTAHYVVDLLQPLNFLKISSLARGVPLGGELDYLDEGTLATALSGRRRIEGSQDPHSSVTSSYPIH